MRHHRGFRSAPALLTALWSLVGAVTAQATEDVGLREACTAKNLSSDACRFYVAGFLDGALLTDTAIIRSLTTDGDADTSDFLARAYQTRVGHLRGGAPATALAEFCLPPELTIDDAAREVLPLLRTDPDTTLQEAVYAAVKTRFPCQSP